MPSCDLSQVTDSTAVAPVGKKEQCREGKHFPSMSRKAIQIALETSEGKLPSLACMWGFAQMILELRSPNVSHLH